MAKRTLVLGCATGIGNAGARLLAARGDRLALGDINAAGVDALAAEIGAAPFHVDAMDTAALQAFVADAAEALGGLDYVWSNVGVQIGGSVETASPEDFDRSFAINVRAPRGRVRRRGAASARGGRRRDLHHRIQLRAALRAEDRAVRGHEGRGARARPPGRARLRQRGHPRQRALPGLDRHALQHARVGELRRARALPRRGAAPRPARAHRHGRGGGKLACFLLSDEPRT